MRYNELSSEMTSDIVQWGREDSPEPRPGAYLVGTIQPGAMLDFANSASVGSKVQE
jgi:hypothetical protein